jgi:hypothetical protein
LSEDYDDYEGIGSSDEWRLGAEGAFGGLIENERFLISNKLIGNGLAQSINGINKGITYFRRQALWNKPSSWTFYQVLLAGLTCYLTFVVKDA